MSHYFVEPSGPEIRRTIRATLWDREVNVETANGVFSGDGLDLGTSVLLREALPRVDATRFLDLGCGWGPLALALGLEVSEGHIDAIDVNPRAISLCQDNARRLKLTNVHAMAPEDVPEDAVYDEIWSNPPIRIGKDALHQLLLTWLPHLAEDGCANLVVSKNLGGDSLQSWLIDQGWPTTRIASAKGFRILRVVRP